MLAGVTCRGWGRGAYACLGLLGAEVLGEDGGVGVRVVAADHDEAIETEALAHGAASGELGGGLDLVTPGADDIEAALRWLG